MLVAQVITGIILPELQALDARQAISRVEAPSVALWIAELGQGRCVGGDEYNSTASVNLKRGPRLLSKHSLVYFPKSAFLSLLVNRYL